MIVSGKCPPTADDLTAASERGFENVELYLQRRHLDDYETTLTICREADVRVTSVHTPHVWRDEHGYFERANALAEALDALLVFHSTAVGLIDLEFVVDDVDFTAPHGFENSNGDSPFYIRNHVFEQGRNLILDVAHLYTGTGPDQFYDEFETLVTDHGESVPLIHLCDSTPMDEGLPLGEGEIDLQRIIRLLKDSYDGIVVLEVMPRFQKSALDAFEAI